MIEIWKDLPYCTYYQVSNFGKVRSKERPVKNRHNGCFIRKAKPVSLNDKGNGYIVFGTRSNGIDKNFHIHRVVAQLFLPNPHNLPEVNHKDGNKANNHVSNLEWATRKTNKHHAVLNNLVAYGEKSAHSKLTENEVLEIISKFKQDPNVNRTRLGNAYGVSDSNILSIIKGNTWKRTWKKFNEINVNA